MNPIISPTPEQIQEMLDHPGFATEPVVMVNLLKFKGEEGARVYYAEYAQPVSKILEEAGGKPLWSGKVDQLFIGEDEDWDAVLIVWYPSRQTLLGMLQRPAYQQYSEARTRGLASTALIVTSATP